LKERWFDIANVDTDNKTFIITNAFKKSNLVGGWNFFSAAEFSAGLAGKFAKSWLFLAGCFAASGRLTVYVGACTHGHITFNNPSI
jgi:hypothetical protein